MKPLAPDIFQLSGFPPDAINVYLVGDVLVDAASRHARGRILRQLKGRAVSAHVITHAHPDHQGSSLAVHRALGVPVWVGRHDADAVVSGDLRPCMPDSRMSRISRTLFAGPACPVARRLSEGDEVAGFDVFEAPGHSPGHIALWREADRVLIVGDVLNGMNVMTGRPGLHFPPAFFTPDPARNRLSARRISAFEPSLVLFGHGPPWRRTEETGPFSEAVIRLIAASR